VARSTRDERERIKEARERFTQGQKAIDHQRRRELEDLAFYSGGDHQWSKEALDARRSQTSANADGLPPVPARPVITINKVREPIHQILNQERQSDMTIELAAADDFGALVGPLDNTEIELREGLIRRIQRASEAADARTWAFMRAVIAGVGYYRVMTRFVQGKSWNKEIILQRIYNQSSVTLDPAHEQPDGSDCEWEFIGTDMRWEDYHRQYRKVADGARNRIERTASDDQFRALGEEAPGWFKVDGKDNVRMVHVAEYFYAEYDTRTLVLLADGTDAWKDEAPEDAEIVDDREVQQRSIHWFKTDGLQILEETDWEGPDMPIVKVLGEELQPFDQERRAEGLVRQARGGNEGYNIFISKYVEMVGNMPLPMVFVAEGQTESFERWYQLMATRSLPFIPYRTKALDGTEVGPPIPVTHNVPVQEFAMGLQTFDEAIKSTTMVPTVQMGQSTDPHLKSGRAINALQQQAQLGTSNFLDNLKRSLRYEGQVVNNLLYPIYGTKPGRLVRIVSGEGESETVQIGPSNGNASPMGASVATAPPGGPAGPVGGPMPPPAMPGAPGMPPPAPPRQFKLTKDANLNVLVKVTRGFDSRRMEESQTIGDMLSANPQLIGWFGDLFFKNQDGPGHEEMAERAKVMLVPPIQQYLASKAKGENIPPQLQAQMASMQERLQKAEQIMQAMGAELKSNQAELDVKKAIESLKMDNARILQEMKDATSIEVARIAAATKHVADVREDTEEAIALGQQHAHEANESALDRQHEADQATRAQTHQAAMGAAQAGAASDQSTQEHQQGMEAAAQPPPIDPNKPPTPPPGGAGSGGSQGA